jgi:hypothetical protein
VWAKDFLRYLTPLAFYPAVIPIKTKQFTQKKPLSIFTSGNDANFFFYVLRLYL